MLLSHPIKKYLPYSLAAAVAYSVAAWIFISKADYAESWILYVGNILFAAVISWFCFFLYRHFMQTRSISKMVIGLHLTSVCAILMACVLCFIGLLVLEPKAFAANKALATDLADAPAQFQGRNKGLMTILFLDAVLGNAATGFFISLIFPFSMMRNQKGNKDGENQGPGKPVDAKPNTEVDSLDQPVHPKDEGK